MFEDLFTERTTKKVASKEKKAGMFGDLFTERISAKEQIEEMAESEEQKKLIIGEKDKQKSISPTALLEQIEKAEKFREEARTPNTIYERIVTKEKDIDIEAQRKEGLVIGKEGRKRSISAVELADQATNEWQKQEDPYKEKNTIKQVGNLFKNIAQETARDFLVYGETVKELSQDVNPVYWAYKGIKESITGEEIKEKKGYTPRTKFEEVITGTEKGEYVTLETIGKEWGKLFGTKDMPKWAALSIGALQMGLDTVTGGVSDSMIKFSAKKIAKTADKTTIVNELKKIIKGGDEEINILAKGLRDVNNRSTIEDFLRKTVRSQKNAEEMSSLITEAKKYYSFKNLVRNKRQVIRNAGISRRTEKFKLKEAFEASRKERTIDDLLFEAKQYDEVENFVNNFYKTDSGKNWLKYNTYKIDKQAAQEVFESGNDLVPTQQLQEGMPAENIKLVQTYDEIEQYNEFAVYNKNNIQDIWEQAKNKNINKNPPKPQRILGEEPRPQVKQPKKREDVGLKEELKKEEVVSKRAARSAKEKEKSIQKAIKKEEIKRLKRKNDIQQLRQRIVDRTQFLHRGFRQGKINKKKDIQQAGNELKQALKESGISSSEMRWFNDTFKNLQGREDLAKKLPQILERTERLNNAEEIRNLKRLIHKEISDIKAKMGPKRALESKFGPDAQNELDSLLGKTPPGHELEELTKITERTTEKGNKKYGLFGDKEKALNEIENIEKKYGVVNEDGTYSIITDADQRKIALLKLTGIQDQGVKELRSTLAEIKTIKQEGRIKALLQKANKDADIERIIDTAVNEDFVSPKKKKKIKPVGEKGKTINPFAKSLHIMENAISGSTHLAEKMTYSKEFKVADWMSEKIRMARGAHSRMGVNWKNKKAHKFREIFAGDSKKPNLKAAKEYRKMNKEKVIFRGKNTAGEDAPLKLNQFQAAYWWGQMQDPTMLSTFVDNMKFTPEMFKAIDDFVDPKMKEYTRFLIDDLFKDIRGVANKRHRVKFLKDMNDNPNYLSIVRENQNLEDITNLLQGESFPHRSSTVPSAVKQRMGSIEGLEKISIEQVARRYMEQMNQFVNFDEVVSDIRRIFMNNDVKKTILENSNKETYDTFLKKIDDLARGGTASQMKIAVLDQIIGNFTNASLMFNWVPFLKQLTSGPAFTIGRKSVTYQELLSGAAAYHVNPVKWTQKLSDSDFIFSRLTQGFNRETALAFKKGDKNFVIKETGADLQTFLKQAAITPTRGGDMVAILPGMTAKYRQVYKKLAKKGLSEEKIHQKALAEAEELAKRTQQSPFIEDLGRIQTANSIGKGITMYSTTPIQYLRESVSTIRQFKRGQVSARTMMRSLITAWIVLPQLFQYVSDGFEWNEYRQMRALVLGPMDYYPAAGNLITTMYDAFASGETWKSVAAAISPLFSIPNKGQRALGELYGSEKDFKKAAEELYEAIALTSGRLPAQLPRTIKGINATLNGEDLRRLIFSKYALSGKEEGITEIKITTADNPYEGMFEEIDTSEQNDPYEGMY